MNHTEYLEEMVGGRIQEPWYTYQCVALSKDYQKRVLNAPVYYYGGSARSAWLNTVNTFPEQEYKRIENTPDNSPQQGDIVFLNTDPLYFHVGICHEADVNTCTILEQNGGKGSGTGTGDDAIRLQKYNYDNILGWYRFDNVEKRVNDFADKYGIKGRSKVFGYTQWETLAILSKVMDER